MGISQLLHNVGGSVLFLLHAGTPSAKHIKMHKPWPIFSADRMDALKVCVCESTKKINKETKGTVYDHLLNDMHRHGHRNHWHYQRCSNISRLPTCLHTHKQAAAQAFKDSLSKRRPASQHIQLLRNLADKLRTKPLVMSMHEYKVCWCEHTCGQGE